MVNIFDWFHFPRERHTNFRYLREFERVMIHLLSASDLDLFKYRFVDVECIEFAVFPIYSYSVGWEDAFQA